MARVDVRGIRNKYLLLLEELRTHHSFCIQSQYLMISTKLTPGGWKEYSAGARARLGLISVLQTTIV